MPSPVTWRRVGPARVTADAALAGGVELLGAAGPDDPVTVAWWEVERPTLVLGRGSRVAPDEAACRAAGIPVVRRSSGGGPVLWDAGLVGLDFVVPRGHAWFSPDVVASYRRVGELLAGALATLGVAARALTPDEARAANDPGLADLACYAGRSPWEVVAGGVKVVGLSQVRRREGALIQAGVALWLDGAGLVGLLRVDNDQAAGVEAALGVSGARLIPAGPAELVAAIEEAVSGGP
jgi:lipoate-protein ligase A